MGLFDKIKEPVILKESSIAKEQLSQLEQLLSATTDSKRKSLIESDISALKSGIYGEETILFELKNSHIPMFVLHDLYLVHEQLSAQIDFLIVTRKRIFVVECKNLYGNITINNYGDFIRVIGNKKEGIYSPVTQCTRHLELIKQIRKNKQGNFLSKAIYERYFYDNYRAVVVLSNPKTVLNARYAPREIKNQVIRADQLIDYIRYVNDESNATVFSENEMEQLAKTFLNYHTACETDYVKKHQVSASTDTKEGATKIEPQQPNSAKMATPVCPKCGVAMIKRKAAKGPHAGEEFWGCSNFPKCRYTISIAYL